MSTESIFIPAGHTSSDWAYKKDISFKVQKP